MATSRRGANQVADGRNVATEAAQWQSHLLECASEWFAPLPDNEDVRYEQASLCCRCGGVLDVRHPTKRSQLCTPCLEDGTCRPAHAVMPHTRGKWWL